MANTFEEQLEEIQRLAGLVEAEIDTSFMARRREQMAQKMEPESGRLQELKDQAEDLRAERDEFMDDLVTVMAELARNMIQQAIASQPGVDPRRARIDLINNPRFAQTQIEPILAAIRSKLMMELGMDDQNPGL